MASTRWEYAWVVEFNCRDPKRSDAAIFLRDLHQVNARRKVRAGTHPIPHPINVVFQVSLEHLDGFPIDARRAPIGLDVPIRLPSARR
jgi:hypothetical protein